MTKSTRLKLTAFAAGAIAIGLFCSDHATADCSGPIQTTWANTSECTSDGVTARSWGTTSPRQLNVWCLNNCPDSNQGNGDSWGSAAGYTSGGSWRCASGNSNGSTVSASCPSDAVKHRVFVSHLM